MIFNKGMFIRLRELLFFASVGVVNSIVHILIFYVLIYRCHLSQSIANLVAFMVSVSCGYLLNSKVTFKKNLLWKRYFFYLFFLGSNAYLFGYIGEMVHLQSWTMVGLFALFSFVISYFWAKFWVFK